MEENKIIQVTEEMKPEIEWFEQASNVKTTDDLVKFIDHLMNDYDHDYGTVVHAVAACAIAAAWVADEKGGGITGFQAGFVMWDFVKHWMYRNNKTGMRIIDFDNMLYPQYENKFDKTISEDTWINLQIEAENKLKEKDKNFVAESVYNHWVSIVEGKVPFGYRVQS